MADPDDADRRAEECLKAFDGCIACVGPEWAAKEIAAAIREAVAAKRAPVWTREAPKVAGWWWFREGGCLPKVVEVWCVAPELPLHATEIGRVTEIEGAWSGPLEAPT